YRLTPVLSDVGQVEALARAVRYSQEQPFGCHVKVDTGMARLGTRREQWPRLIQALVDAPELSVFGLMSHLANADLGQEAVLEQPLALFNQAHAQFVQGRVVPKARHLANSAALLRDARTHFDLVRPGLALFGVDPCPPLVDRVGTAGEVRFKPAMSVLSRVVSLRHLHRGDGVGYGGTYVAGGPTWIATVPMGYADGLSRALSNRGHALIRGRRVPIVGNISMDMTMVDVSLVPGVTIGDEVVFLGAQTGPLGQDTITPEEVARHSGTIPWEVLTNISRRVPRFYRED
ncbi:MAG TPA: alanine racemase, partial [Polyangiaceae bacterium]|nr:alanine racemase [Polyangiaceae bacterium]